MLTFVVRRALILLATLVVASAAIFIVLEVLPGDPALLILGLEAQEDTLAALRAQMGLDRPPLERYLAWIAGMAVGQTGVSHTYAVPVGELIAARLQVTIPLALLAFVASSLLAVPLGMFAATRRNRPGDYGVMEPLAVRLATNDVEVIVHDPDQTSLQRWTRFLGNSVDARVESLVGSASC